MAKRYLDWPGGLTVYDVRAEAMTPFVEAGATAAASAAEVADADIISVTVLNDEQVRDVVGQLAEHAKPGTIIAIHSTISDATAVELAAALEPRGIHVVDAPVSGGAAVAAKGELATMLGAEREVYERIKPVFKQWASLIIHAGEPGAGTRMKLARNMLTFTYYAAACEAMRLAEAAGLDLQALGRVVRHTEASTGAGNIMIRDNMAPLAPDHFLYQPFSHASGSRREGSGTGVGAGRRGGRRTATRGAGGAESGRRARRPAHGGVTTRCPTTNCAARASRR